MVDKAIEKLRDEMAQNASITYLGEIGEYLCDYVHSRPRAAEAIMQADKTIGGAVKALEAHAWKQARTGSMVMVGPEEGFEVIREYFGIGDADAGKKVLSFGVSLDDLLGEG